MFLYFKFYNPIEYLRLINLSLKYVFFHCLYRKTTDIIVHTRNHAVYDPKLPHLEVVTMEVLTSNPHGYK